MRHNSLYFNDSVVDGTEAACHPIAEGGIKEGRWGGGVAGIILIRKHTSASVASDDKATARRWLNSLL